MFQIECEITKTWLHLCCLFALRAHLHQASALMQSQRCIEACNKALIEMKGVTPRWVAIPFFSDSICFRGFQ